MNKVILYSFIINLLWSTTFAMTEQHIISVKVDQGPIIDGHHDDSVWNAAATVATVDGVENTEITLKSVYTDEEIFFVIEFPDKTENRAHKTLVWDETLDVYRSGPKREDSFVFKWSMEPHPVDLAITGDDIYRADIWYWKADRTDSAGYADDKMHVYSTQQREKAKRMISKNGAVFYLYRPSDSGTSTYKSITYDQFAGQEVPRYRNRQPEGSRADVRAKGYWKDGVWCIEFSRKLNTGHIDDVQFDTSLTYRFGVSLREIAGKEPNPDIEQPNYESGEIGEHLALSFQ